MKLIITLLIGLGLYFLQAYVFKRIWSKGLDGQVFFSEPVIRVGDKAVLTEIIENRKAFPVFMLQVKFEISRKLDFGEKTKGTVSDLSYRHDSYSVKGHSRVTREYPFTAVGRGCFSIESFDFVAYDIFMSHKQIKRESFKTHITVLPKRLKESEYSPEIKRLTGEIVRTAASLEDPFEFIGIREYTTLDSPKRINWKASAKTDSLLVNKYGTTVSSEVRILLNLNLQGYSDKDDLTEGMISLCATLAAYFIDNNLSVSFLTNAYDFETEAELSLLSGSSAGHLTNLEVLLARIDTEKEPSGFAELLKKEKDQVSSGVQYLIISNEQRSEVMEAVEALENEAGADMVSFISPKMNGNLFEADIR